jgi:prepilin-type N-terminal cleavage/methylation domain-containing protein
VSKRGFTLVEIMIATGIAGFIAFVGYFAISTTITASNAATARVRDTENARLFFSMLKREIATAFPGPGNMIKGRGDASITNYDPNNNQSSLVLSDKSANPPSDVIQFYSRVDSPSLQEDQVLFVRYYMNRADNTLCRQAQPCNPTGTPPNATSPYDEIPPNISKSDALWPLFDNVRSLRITFEQWDPNAKVFNSEVGAKPVSPSVCDTLLVTLTFTDVVAQKAIVAGGTSATNASSSTSTPSTFDLQTARTFSTVIPIPTTFGP